MRDQADTIFTFISAIAGVVILVGVFLLRKYYRIWIQVLLALGAFFLILHAGRFLYFHVI